MSEEEIKQKLKDNGLENYIPIFQDNHLLDADVLASLTNEDYISVGITILGDRKKLQLLFSNDIKETVSVTEPKKEEFIDITRGGKDFCYKASEPEKLLCRKCHAEVSDESTMCWNCNNALVSKDKPQMEINLRFNGLNGNIVVKGDRITIERDNKYAKTLNIPEKTCSLSDLKGISLTEGKDGFMIKENGWIKLELPSNQTIQRGLFANVNEMMDENKVFFAPDKNASARSFKNRLQTLL
ncbi:MAG: hypothetical protein VZR56_09875 [Treponema sp.]|nr:hypothetical protein [Treponema sp.]